MKKTKWLPAVVFSVLMFCFLPAAALWINYALKPCRPLDISFNRSGCQEITPLDGSEFLQLSRDGSVLISYPDNNGLEILDLKTGELKTIPASVDRSKERRSQFNIALTSDGNYAAVIGNMNGRSEVGLVDTTLEQPVLQILPIAGYPDEVVISPDDKVLAVATYAGQAGYVTFFDIPSGEQVERLNLAGANFAVAYSPDGRLITAMNGHVQIWDVNHASIEKRIGSQLPTIYSAEFSTDGAYLAVSSGGTEVNVFSMPDGQALYTFLTKDHGISPKGLPVAFSPDGTLLAVSSCYVIDVYRLSDGTRVATFRSVWVDFGVISGVCLTDVQFTPDGQSLYYGWTHGGVVRWSSP